MDGARADLVDQGPTWRRLLPGRSRVGLAAGRPGAGELALELQWGEPPHRIITADERVTGLADAHHAGKFPDELKLLAWQAARTRWHRRRA